MDAPEICKQCQQPLPANAPQGLCPACLAEVALGTRPAAPGATININPLAGPAAPPSEPPSSSTRVPPDVAHLAAQFPQLEIVELLGMGGMGIVYKARQPRLDRFVALKILAVESQQHPSFAERFNREAKALAKLNHPGIVNIYDFGQTGQYYYFVMEYVDGMNLRALLNSETITPQQALELVVQIGTALQYAHDEGVVHRDIKPENILINKKGQVKIADFGLAKLLGNAPDTALTMSQAAMGTLNYMAPEQRLNAQSVDHRADIYSLGVVFYEMLTGEVPMGRFEPPSRRVQVDVRLDEVVLRALEREPARRYQQASEVKTDVESFTENRTDKQAKHQPQTSPSEWPAVAVEVVKLLALIAVIGFAMGMLHSAWPLILLLVGTLKFDQSAGPQEKRWGKTVWVVGVIGLCGCGIWISKSAWPVVGLFFLFDWNEGNAEEKEESDEEKEESREEKRGSERVDLAQTLPTSKSASVSSSKAVPRLFWLRVYGLFLSGWLATKFLWNFRGSGCWLACLGMAALVVWVSLKRMRLFPEQLAGYSKTSVSQRVTVLALCFFMLTAGFAFLIAAFFHCWQSMPLASTFAAQSAEQYQAGFKGNEFHLLQGLGAFRQDIPTVEMAGPYGTWSGGWDIGWRERGPGYHWTDVGPDLFLGFVIMLWFSFSLIGAWRMPGPGVKFFPFWTPHARASLAVCATVLGGALSVFVFSVSAYAFSGVGADNRAFRCATNIDAVTEGIQKWAAKNGYAMGDEYNWNINTVPTGNRVAQARLREAWKPSPFDRWRSTWSTFRPVSPHLAFQIVGSEQPAETVVNVGCMVSCSPEQLKNGTCPGIPESLISTLEHLQSATNAAPHR